MKSMDERYALIRKALTGGKKMLLQEIAAAIDEDKSRTRTALERMCELGQVYREGGGLRGIKAVYFLAPVLEVQTESQDKAEVSTEPECQAKKKSPDAAGGIWASDIDKMRERVQVGDTVGHDREIADIAPQGESDQQAPASGAGYWRAQYYIRGFGNV